MFLTDDIHTAPLYLAGRPASPGRYLDVETRRLVVLERESVLPASLDGRVAAYVLLPTPNDLSRNHVTR